mmetsp:Transcript_5648/g.35058  ORF Transcript_5648/g.35058 Transcript_5648/m.35058 type:complete len:267 (-) Transcript_5648:2269-3069(-)
MIDHLLQSGPLGWIRYQHAGQQRTDSPLLGSTGRNVRKFTLGIAHYSIDGAPIVPRLLRIIEWIPPHQHCVQHHAQGPNVRCFPTVLRSSCPYYFWCDVCWCAYFGLGDRVRDVFGVSKVAELHFGRVRVSIQQGVFQFHIPVAESHSVQVVQPASDLLKEVPGLVFSQPSFRSGNHVIEERSTTSVFHDDGQVRGRQEDFSELDDLRVVQDAVVEHFSPHVLVDGFFATFDVLDGVQFVGLRVSEQLDETVRATSDLSLVRQVLT